MEAQSAGTKDDREARFPANQVRERKGKRFREVQLRLCAVFVKQSAAKLTADEENGGGAEVGRLRARRRRTAKTRCAVHHSGSGLVEVEEEDKARCLGVVLLAGVLCSGSSRRSSGDGA